jgi:predicted nuclease of restriction endonuclease-like (RecB) superfamily
MLEKTTPEVYGEIKKILIEARSNTYRAINTEIVDAYWKIGRLIVEAQGGENSTYGTSLLAELSNNLKQEFGKGFDVSNLRKMRKFYIMFENQDTLCPNLSWSHYRTILKVDNLEARKFYIEECDKSRWSVRELNRQVNTFYYERLLSSQNDELVEKNMLDKKEEMTTKDIIKDPYVLEFLGIKKYEKLLENDLESGLITHLADFLLELGRGFSFVGRQKRFYVDGQNFFIDLVFYNYILKCFVIIDLKMGELTHQDIGQMQMYVNYYTREMMNEGDNKPIGIVLCSDKSDAVVKYTLPEDNDQIFASKYLPYLPTEEEFAQELKRERELLEIEND